jgi:hypothetical protein
MSDTGRDRSTAAHYAFETEIVPPKLALRSATTEYVTEKELFALPLRATDDREEPRLRGGS